MMLEDESGRLRITGLTIARNSFVTGCVIACLGTEQADGSFNVIATQSADLPRQPQRWERDTSSAAVKGKNIKQKREKSGKVAFVSGLEITGSADDDISLDLLMEYMTGEATTPTCQTSVSKISRLVIAGNSLSNSSPIPSREEFASRKANHKKHYGYDASAYNASPSERFDELLSEILPTIPITLLPGPSDPSTVAIPQQPLHPALLPRSRVYANLPVQSNETLQGLDSVSNPWEGDIEGWRVLGTGGQTVDDLLKYVEDNEALDVMEAMLRWGCVAPTAPDTLCMSPIPLYPLMLHRLDSDNMQGATPSKIQTRFSYPIVRTSILQAIKRILVVALLPVLRVRKCCFLLCLSLRKRRSVWLWIWRRWRSRL